MKKQHNYVLMKWENGGSKSKKKLMLFSPNYSGILGYSIGNLLSSCVPGRIKIITAEEHTDKYQREVT